MVTYSFSFMLGGSKLSERVAAEIVKFVACPGWGEPLRYFSSIAVPGKRIPRRAGMLRPASLEEVLTGALLHEDVLVISMSTSERNTDTFATCYFDTQRIPWRSHLLAYGRRPAGTNTVTRELWLSHFIDLADRSAGTTGVVFAAQNAEDAARESDVLSGRAPPDSPTLYTPQWRRMLKHREAVGTRYVRFPRWGTLYSHEHVTALGGTPRITAAVQPAVVRELSGGVYFQMTDSLDTALSEESIAKQRAFEEVAAPLLPPPI